MNPKSISTEAWGLYLSLLPTQHIDEHLQSSRMHTVPPEKHSHDFVTLYLHVGGSTLHYSLHLFFFGFSFYVQ